jgi:hypothetical protein
MFVRQQVVGLQPGIQGLHVVNYKAPRIHQYPSPNTLLIVNASKSAQSFGPGIESLMQSAKPLI